MTAQVILAMDDAGRLICEAPGSNGQRVKVEGLMLSDLPLVIQTELLTQRDRARAARQATTLAPTAQRPDPEVERHRRNEEAAKERLEAWNRYLDTLTDAERERQIALRDARLEKAKNQQLETAKSIWYTTAQRHGPKLANRAIAAGRRPRVAKQFTDAGAEAGKPGTKRAATKADFGLDIL